MRGVLFYGCIGAFATGTAFALLGRITVGGSALVLIIAVAGGALCFVSPKKGFLCTALVIVLGFGVGAFRTSFELYQNREHALDASVGEHVSFTATIAEDPVIGAAHQKIILQTENGKLIAFAPVYPAFAYGDVVTAHGMLERPERFVTESGRTFDYPAYLAKDGIYHVLDKPKLTEEEGWQGSVIKRWFVALRHRFVGAIERAVPEPYAGFAAGVVLGVDGALSKEDEEMFRDAGLIHIVVVSGYNITLVGDMIARTLSSLPIVVASTGSLLGIVAFIMTTGASATAIRAGIMATLVLLARLTKRHYDMQRALVAAGFLMVLHTPGILLHDPSFQLSFLATWGLGTLTPFTQKLFKFVPFSPLRDIAATTLATQAAVTPLLLYMSGKVSILSLPANILVLPFMPAIMIGALVIGTFGFLPQIALLPATVVVQGVGMYVFAVARFFAL